MAACFETGGSKIGHVGISVAVKKIGMIGLKTIET